MDILEVVWDEEKNALNKRKHKISFEEAKKFSSIPDDLKHLIKNTVILKND